MLNTLLNTCFFKNDKTYLSLFRIHRKLAGLSGMICFLFFTSVFTSAKLPEGFVEKKIADGLDPTAMAIASDGRIFIAEKNGRVLIVRDDILLDDPFIHLEVDNYNERGLSGIALHPDFDSNGYVYMFYTVPEENENRTIRVQANGDLAIPGSEEIIMVLDKLSGTIHNGGAMHFGPDGKLYISVGDGTQGNNSQDLNNLLGKVLRINDDGSIPNDNPYYDQLEGDFRAIWAYGFRNPFTMAIQPSSGRVFANDVGRDKWEEVNEIVAGGNYGWNLVTGMSTNPDLPENYKNPAYAYSHDEGCSVIGAVFYEPEIIAFPDEYFGDYFFGDYCRGYIKRMDPESKEILEVFATEINRPLQFLVSPNGDMYYLERNGIGGGSMVDNTSTDNGVLWRIRYTGSGLPAISLHPQDVLVSVGETASFRVGANGSDPLAYQWLKNGIDIPEETNAELHIENVQLQDDGTIIQCIALNEYGRDTSDVALLGVTRNTRPLPVIIAPAEGDTYSAGDTILFKGQVTDAEDGNINPLQYLWKIDFHHNEHTHPALNWVSGTDSGTYIIPRIGEIDDNVWYRIYLSVADSEGLTQTEHRDIFPRKTSFMVNTEPEGLRINIDGRIEMTPVEILSVEGIFRTLQAINFQVFQGENYVFRNWASGNSESIQSFFADVNTDQYTARFEKLPKGEGIGLLGQYFESDNQSFNVRPSLVRIDPVIDFDWGNSSPNPDRIREDHFNVLWSGEVETLSSGEYTFYTTTDDGVRLWVDNELIIDQWAPQAPTEHQGKINLEEATRYALRMEYYEAGGGAVARLQWKNAEIKKQTISSSQLYPGQITNQSGSFFAQIHTNPVADDLDLIFDSLEGGLIIARVIDFSGQWVLSEKISFYPGEWEHSIDVSTLVPGAYILFMENEVSSQTIEFIKS